MTQRTQFIAWRPDTGEPVYLPDAVALARWAQARRLTTVDAWKVDDLAREVRPATFTRDGDAWTLRVRHQAGKLRVPADPSDDPRTLMVVNYVEQHLSCLGVGGARVALRPERFDPAGWERATAGWFDPTNAYAPFGYLPPVRGDLGWVIRYCPEIIAEQTAPLPEGLFVTYLEALDLRLVLNIVHQHMEPLERERLIDEVIHDFGPGHSVLLTEVQMRALDARAAG